MRKEYDLSAIKAYLIVASDRVLAGRENKAEPVFRQHLNACGSLEATVVAEEYSAIRSAITEALDAGSRLVIVAGASGFGVGNEAPEAVRDVIAVEIPGIAEQIRTFGAVNTPLAVLSREVVGVTGRTPGSALVLSSPGSAGGLGDTLEVLTPLLSAIFRQLDEER